MPDLKLLASLLCGGERNEEEERYKEHRADAEDVEHPKDEDCTTYHKGANKWDDTEDDYDGNRYDTVAD